MSMLRRLLVMLCLLAFLGGCSTGFVYNRLDWLVVWYVDGMVELSEEQRDDLREAARRNIEWHRQTQLPAYAEYCRTLQTDLVSPVTLDVVRARYQQMLGFYDTAAIQIAPDVMAFLQDLSDDQIDEFFGSVGESREELVDEYSARTPEQQQKKRKKTTVKSFQRLTGRLDGDQRELISAHLDTTEDLTEDWIANRLAWEDRYQTLVRERPADPEYLERLTQLLLYPQGDSRDPYYGKFEENLEKVLNMTTDVLVSLNPDQKRRALARIGNYAETFEGLAGDGVPAEVTAATR